MASPEEKQQSPSGPLGIIAGEGQFPFLVAEGARSLGKAVVAVGFRGHTRKELETHVDRMQWVRLGQLGKLLRFFKRHGACEIVFAGGINKPRALSIRPDFHAARLLLALRSRTDNALLEAVAQSMAKRGMRAVSPLKYAPGLQTPEGVLGSRRPLKRESGDIEYGWPLAKELGRLDIGQCLVVRERMVVAVEALEGTNATILRAGELAGPGCVVIKTFKPGQEQHIDQPAVGLSTIETMIRSGASCLAIEAGQSLFFDRDKALSLAEEHGIAIVGCSRSPL
jgi:hypothetical protein